MPNTYDQVVLEQAMDTDENVYDFSGKQWVELLDDNKNVYNQGTILFKGSQLANASEPMDFRNGYCLIPQVAEVTFATAVVDAPELAYMLSFKNGSQILIDQQLIRVGNTAVNNPNTNTGMSIYWKNLTTMSEDDVNNYSQIINFSKDTFASATYQSGANANGVGECNNKIASAVWTPTGGWGNTTHQVNYGRRTRQQQTSFDPSNVANNGTLANTTSALCGNVFKNYCTHSTTSVRLFYVAVIPLKDLHPFFDALPLTKNMMLDLTLYTNSNCSCSVTVDTATYTGFSTTATFGTFPLQISPIGVGNGSCVIPNQTFTVSCGIGKGYTSGTAHPFLTQCKLVIPKMKFTPTFDEMYFSRNSVKKLLFNDIFTPANVVNLTAGTRLNNYNLITSIDNARSLLILPYFSSQSHYSGATTTAHPSLSPFSSAPCQTMPYGFLTQMQILVGGKPLFETALNYGYEHFLNNVRNCNSINGGLVLGSSSGLYSYEEWMTSPIYFIDLSRYLNRADDLMAKRIDISFTNSSARAMDISFILTQQKELMFDCALGQLVKDN